MTELVHAKEAKQLSLPLRFASGSNATAWIVVMCKDDADRAIRWLSGPPNQNTAPFFVDATTGRGLVSSGDAIVILHPPDGSATMCIPRSLASLNPDLLLSAIVAQGRPQGIFGPTAFLHDGLLIKPSGGVFADSKENLVRSLFDLAIERLSSRPYRSNREAVSAVCESSLRFPLSNEMLRVIEGVWAEAASRELISEAQPELLINELKDAAKKFRLRSLHRAGATLFKLATSLEARAGAAQLEMFGHEIEATALEPPRQSLRRIRCSLVPISFELSGIASDVPTDVKFARNDNIISGKRINLQVVRRWFSATAPLTLIPSAKKERDKGDQSLTLVKIRVVPEFLTDFSDSVLCRKTAMRTSEKWEVVPVAGARSFSPRSRVIGVGETATFLVNRAQRQDEKELSVHVLTQGGGAVRLLLPLSV